MDTLEKIPWYRTRKFWGVVIGMLALLSTAHYFLYISGSVSSISGFFFQLALSFGALPLVIFLDGLIGKTVPFVVYVLVMLLLIYKTFSKEKIRLVYPLTFTTIYLCGFTLRIFLSGLI